MLSVESNQPEESSETQKLVEENQRLSGELQRARADSVTATPRSQGSFTTVHVPGGDLRKACVSISTPLIV